MGSHERCHQRHSVVIEADVRYSARMKMKYTKLSSMVAHQAGKSVEELPLEFSTSNTREINKAHAILTVMVSLFHLPSSILLLLPPPTVAPWKGWVSRMWKRDSV